MIPDEMFTVAEQDYRDGEYSGTPMYTIWVDEGWRQYPLCTDMYLDKAEWLAKVLNQNGQRPGTWV